MHFLIIVIIITIPAAAFLECGAIPVVASALLKQELPSSPAVSAETTIRLDHQLSMLRVLATSLVATPAFLWGSATANAEAAAEAVRLQQQQQHHKMGDTRATPCGQARVVVALPAQRAVATLGVLKTHQRTGIMGWCFKQLCRAGEWRDAVVAQWGGRGKGQYTMAVRDMAELLVATVRQQTSKQVAAVLRANKLKELIEFWFLTTSPIDKPVITSVRQAFAAFALTVDDPPRLLQQVACCLCALARASAHASNIIIDVLMTMVHSLQPAQLGNTSLTLFTTLAVALESSSALAAAMPLAPATRKRRRYNTCVGCVNVCVVMAG